MKAIRITQKLDSETLYLPQLRAWLGKDVEIVVRETSSGVTPNDDEACHGDLVGSVLHFEDPFGPAVPPEEWESNR